MESTGKTTRTLATVSKTKYDEQMKSALSGAENRAAPRRTHP